MLDVSAANATGGSINLGNFSATNTLTIGGGSGQFTLKAAGTSGGTTGTGGLIRITNLAGSIINVGAITKVGRLDEQVNGAKSVITINNTLGVDNTSEIDLGSDAGAITSAKAITTGVFDAESTSGAITFSKLNATDITALTGSAKTSNVTITNVGTGSVNINRMAGYNISFKSAGNITGSNSIDAQGTAAVSTTAKSGATIKLNEISALSTVTVSSTGAMTFGQVDGTKGVKLSNKDAGAGINLNDNISSTAGTISITSLGAITSGAGDDLSAAKGVTLTSSKGAITIATVGADDPTSALTATAFTKVATTGAITTTTSATLKATDKTLASGLITIGGPITVTSTKGSLTLTAGPIGTVDDALSVDGTKVSAGKITVTAPGGATFNHDHLSSTGSTLAITSAKGGVTIGTNATLGSFSTVTLTGLTDFTNHGQITGATGVTASSKGADNKTGTLTTDGSITASGATAKVTLTTTGNLQQNGTILSGGDVNLKASVGSLSTNASSTTTSTNGKVILAAIHTINDQGSLKAKTNISVTTTAKLQADSLTVGNLNTTEGNISVIGAGGLVSTTSGALIKADSSLTKTKATLLIEDSNITVGINSAISIDGTLSTHGPGGGNVSISIGAPGTGKNPSPPATLTGFTISNTGGTVFAGAVPTALIVTGGGKAALTTVGKNIIMTSPSASRTITFTDTSQVTADPPVNGTVVTNALSGVAAPIRILPIIQAGPLAPPSSNNSITVNTVPIASTFNNSAGLNASIANSRTISGGVSYNDESPISDISPSMHDSSYCSSYSSSYRPSGNTCYKWISATELDGGAIPAIFIGQGTSSAQATLPSGTALVSPSQDMTIETPHGKVFVAARSLAIVMALPNGLAVYNLHDLKGGSVGIERDGKRINIAPATAAVLIADKRFAFADVNPAQLVCYGKINETLMENGKLFSAEFSLPSAINAMPALKGLISSKDKQTTKISGAFLKTVAIMQTLSGANYQDFRQHVRPVMTACK